MNRTPPHTPVGDGRSAAPACSVPPGTSTCTGSTGCTAAPTWCADLRAPPGQCWYGRWPHWRVGRPWRHADRPHGVRRIWPTDQVGCARRSASTLVTTVSTCSQPARRSSWSTMAHHRLCRQDAPSGSGSVTADGTCGAGGCLATRPCPGPGQPAVGQKRLDNAGTAGTMGSPGSHRVRASARTRAPGPAPPPLRGTCLVAP